MTRAAKERGDGGDFVEGLGGGFGVGGGLEGVVAQEARVEEVVAVPEEGGFGRGGGKEGGFGVSGGIVSLRLD